MEELTLTPLADPLPGLQGMAPVAFAAGPDGEAIYLGQVDQARATVESDGQQESTESPKDLVDPPDRVALTCVDGREAWRITLKEEGTRFPLVQPLPQGELLLVGSRCGRFPDGSLERNARVFDRRGNLLRDFSLGDGIQDVQTTRQGEVWVSYFDEGVFGNLDWGMTGGEEPIGVTGLVRYNSEGTKEWVYSEPPDVAPIVDCYALNVADWETWAYYYSAFPLVRIRPDGEIKVWRTEVHGARALVVAGDRVLFFGGYDDDRWQCSLWRIGDSELSKEGDVKLLLPNGESLSGGWIVGRGPALHCFVGASWYQLDLRAI